MQSRRAMLAGSVALIGLAAAGCGPGAESSDEARAAPPLRRAAGELVMHRDPHCGCCLAWAALAEQAGYAVRVVEEADMGVVKARLGVPEELASCHTVRVDGLVIEGHVPLAAIAALRARRPDGVIGLAVPGMPRGSPGMEMPDGSVDPYQVFAFDRFGRVSVFA